MTDQTNKLEPCPFCGPGESVVTAYIDDTVSRWRVGCGRCGCSTGFHPTDKTRAPAIAAWNRRASTPADILRMRQQLEQEWCELQKLKASYASAPAALSTGDLRDRLVAVSSAIADQDDRGAQAILREALRLLDSAPAAGSVPSDAELDALANRFTLDVEGKRILNFYDYGRALLAQYGSPARGGVPETRNLSGDAKLAHDQCRVVAYLARSLADVYDARALILDAGKGPVEIIGEASAADMELLGDCLNNMDAVGDDDSWMDPIYERAQQRWPLPPAPQEGK